MPLSNDEQLLLNELGIESTEEVEQQEAEETAEVTEEGTSEQEETEETQAPKVDYELEVPLTNGEKITVGKLKDAYQAQHKAQLELTERENALMGKQRDVEELLGLVKNVPPELKERVRQQQEHYLREQHRLMLDTIPEFKEPTSFEKARQDIFALADEYGVKDVISTVSDHRIVKMLHDYAKLRNNIRSVEVKPAPKPAVHSKPKPAGKATNNVDELVQKAKNSRNADVQLAAINELIGS